MTWKAFVSHASGETCYAKPLQLTDSPWSGDVLTRTGVQFGVSEFDCNDAVDNYGFFIQAGGSPANTDQVIATARRPQSAGGLDAAGVRAAIGLGSANLDTQLAAIVADTGTDIPATLTTIAQYLDTEIAAILADTDELQTDWADGGRLDLLIDALTTELAKVEKLNIRYRHTQDAVASGTADVTVTEAP